MAYEAPAENYDLDFRSLIVVPYATYEDTLVGAYGAETAKAAEIVDAAQLALGSVYRWLEANADGTSDETAQEAARTYLTAVARHTLPVKVTGLEEEILALAVRYQRGEGEDYDAIQALTI